MSDFIFRDLEKFETYIPTAAGSDKKDLKPFLQEAEIWLKELLGEGLYDKIICISELPPEDQTTILRDCELVICLKAYLSGIPFLDLIQTSNGFAVVSNASQAPASKERVERLLEFVQYRLTQALDELIRNVFKDDQLRVLWKESAWFNWYTETVFLTSNSVRLHTGRKTTFVEFERLHITLLDHQNEVCRFISRDYFNELIDKRREKNLSEYDKQALSELRTIIGMKLQSLDAYKMVESLVNFMIAHADKFPTYMASVEYKLKIEQKYENKRQHSTFFFNG